MLSRIVFIAIVVLFVQSNDAVRISVSSMTDDQVRDYRDAVRTAEASGSFDRVAADHGEPNYYCPHGSIAFLPWHRRFVARMEAAIGTSIPYWDWTVDGFPSIFTDKSYTDKTGRSYPNPLLFNRRSDGRRTARQSTRIDTNSLAATIRLANQEEDFEEFTSTVEMAHNTVHGSIGGDMGTVQWSAYDPIFWSHHMFVERVFWRWQLDNSDASYPRGATGSMRDSDGSFRGSDQINNRAAWPSSSGSRPASADLLMRPQLFAMVQGLPTTENSALVSITVFNQTIGSVFNLGMGKMPTRQTNGAIHVTDGYVRLANSLNSTVADLQENAVVHCVDQVTHLDTILTNTNVTMTWVML